MNGDYPYKITRQDKNLSEVEYVQVSNEVKPVGYVEKWSLSKLKTGEYKSCTIYSDKVTSECVAVYTSPLSPEEMLVVLNALKDNHEWHQNHDDYGGYEDCQLSDVNHAAIKLLESRL